MMILLESLRWIAMSYFPMCASFAAIGIYQVYRKRSCFRAFLSAVFLFIVSQALELFLFWPEAPVWLHVTACYLAFAGPLFFILCGIWVFRRRSVPKPAIN